MMRTATSICRHETPPEVVGGPFAWTGSPAQQFVRGEWEKYRRLSREERARYEVRRYSADGMIVPVLKETGVPA